MRSLPKRPPNPPHTMTTHLTSQTIHEPIQLTGKVTLTEDVVITCAPDFQGRAAILGGRGCWIDGNGYTLSIHGAGWGIERPGTDA